MMNGLIFSLYKLGFKVRLTWNTPKKCTSGAELAVISKTDFPPLPNNNKKNQGLS
jgi:hypothetical protein